MSATDSTGSSGSNRGHSTNASSGWSDRVLGLVCVVIGIWYTAEARTFDGTAFSAGPVGPKTLPSAIGVIFAVLALYLIVKPDRGVDWPTKRAWWQIGLVILASYGYGRVVEPIGFIAASAFMTLVLGLLFRAQLRKLAPLSIAFPVVVAYVFNNWLELRLPAGWWGGF
jgi:putative tricarboxylic transport membrane protein